MECVYSHSGHMMVLLVNYIGFKMAVEALTSSLPDLVTAVSGSVKSVSDQCLAKGLIPECVHEEVLELGATRKDKARILVLAVKKSTETDERCFELFLNVLEQELPYTSRDRLLNDIRKEVANPCTAVVPSSQIIQQIPRGELSKECAIQQKTLLERLEEAIRKHQSACDEKKNSEERLKMKTEECEELRRALETQTQKDKDDAKSKISVCESEIENLKTRVKELESIIEEQDMQARRGRNDTIMKTRQMFAMIAQESHAAGQEKAKEKMRDREHKLTIQEKDIRIKELEDKSKQQRDSPDSSNVVPEDALSPTTIAPLRGYLKSSGVNQKKELKHSMQWYKDLALRLGFTEEEYDTNYEGFKCTCIPVDASTDAPRGQVSHLEKPHHRCRMHHVAVSDNIYDIILLWVQWYPGDRRGTTSFPTYSRLKRALVDQGLGNIARELPRDFSGLS